MAEATDAGTPAGDCAAAAPLSAAPPSAVDAFVRELSGRYNDRLPAVHFLLQHGACSRCCLRFSGKTSPCKVPDVSRPLLLDAVAAALTGHGTTASSKAAAAAAAAAAALAAARSQSDPADSSDGAAEACFRASQADAKPSAVTNGASALDGHAANQSGEPAAAHGTVAANGVAPDSDVEQTSLAAPDLVCPLCLGMLQSLDASARLQPGGQAIALPDTDAGGGTWHLANSGAADTLAKVIRREGHETAHCALSVSVPGATQLRQVAALRALAAALPDAAWLMDVAAANGRLLDVKGALRHALAPQLGRALGWQVTAGSDVGVTLMYMHPGTNAELDFLYGPAGDRKRYKRRRGERGPSGKGLAAIGHTQGPQPTLVHDTSTSTNAGRISSDSIAKSAAAAAPEDIRRQCGIPPTSPAHGSQVAVKVVRGPVFVAGRYRKLGHNISNSPWLPGKCVTSVSEELARGLLPGMRADSYKFNSAGREDFDVRMLGSGRPFTLEFANSRPSMAGPDFFARAQQELNARGCGVEVAGLRAASRADAALLKEGEEAKQKSYRAVCRLSRPPSPEQLAALNATQDLVLAQQTPVRVAKRRADMVRTRTIHSIRCDMVPGTDNHCTLDLRTQAGTYIKEFVHSDEGRTKPSLGSLLDCDAEILQLDVMDIHMEF